MKQFFKKIISAILRAEAEAVLKKYRPKIIAVIGSVGKTSVKDAVFSVLARQFFVRKSEKSFNSDIGIPLTILGLQNAWNNPFGWAQNILKGLRLLVVSGAYPEWLVLEIGVDRPGDMKTAAQWIHPDIIIVTKFADVPVHVEYFSSPQAVIDEKSSLISSLKKNGILVLNHDDEKVLALREKWRGKTITYGFSEEADAVASHLVLLYGEDDLERKFPAGVLLRVDVDHKSVPIRIYGTLGKSAAYSTLAALAAGVGVGMNLVEISNGLAAITPPPGRMRILPAIKKALIIDDSYNASPVAMAAALNTLKELSASGRKFAVLGDMLELGKYSKEEHLKIGAFASESCDVLLCVGVRARGIAEGARAAGMEKEKVYSFDSSRDAGKYLEKLIGEGDIVLVKGSQGSGANKIRMERAVEEIMAEPERKSELLVRQGAEWENR